MFKEFPVAWAYALNVALGLLVSFGINMSEDVTGAVVTVATGVFAMFAALTVRPVAIAAFGAAMSTVLVAIGAFGFDLTTDQIGYLTAAVSVVLGFLTHQSVSPPGGVLDRPVIGARSSRVE